ncbi:MAG: translation initiation factor eIF-1A [Halobacteriota archaeon]
MNEEEVTKVRLPRKNENENEILGIVEAMLGANRVRIRCLDGRIRMGRIPGKMKKRVWLRAGDIVIIKPWSFQDDKGDIVWRYQGPQVEWLKRNGYR